MAKGQTTWISHLKKVNTKKSFDGIELMEAVHASFDQVARIFVLTICGIAIRYSQEIDREDAIEYLLGGSKVAQSITNN